MPRRQKRFRDETEEEAPTKKAEEEEEISPVRKSLCEALIQLEAMRRSLLHGLRHAELGVDSSETPAFKKCVRKVARSKLKPGVAWKWQSDTRKQMAVSSVLQAYPEVRKDVIREKLRRHLCGRNRYDQHRTSAAAPKEKEEPAPTLEPDAPSGESSSSSGGSDD